MRQRLGPPHPSVRPRYIFERHVQISGENQASHTIQDFAWYRSKSNPLTSKSNTGRPC